MYTLIEAASYIQCHITMTPLTFIEKEDGSGQNWNYKIENHKFLEERKKTFFIRLPLKKKEDSDKFAEYADFEERIEDCERAMLEAQNTIDNINKY